MTSTIINYHCYFFHSFLMESLLSLSSFQLYILLSGIVLTGVGVCAAYINFLTSTLPVMLNDWFNTTFFTHLSVNVIVGPITLALAYLRNFKWLSFTSILGDVAVTAGESLGSNCSS